MLEPGADLPAGVVRDYLWVAAWPTDFGFMFREGLDALPERKLTDSDD
jgi:hypothetical protein